MKKKKIEGEIDMLNLNEIARECLEELDALEINYGKIERFEVNTRALKRWGQCRAVPGGYTINISARLLEDEKSIKGLKETIIHEIIHTCKGCMNHGTEWKRIVNIVNNKYGYNIKRTSSSEEKQVNQISMENYKHKVVCNGCGREVYKIRECSITQHPESWKCGVCGSHFSRVY